MPGETVDPRLGKLFEVHSAGVFRRTLHLLGNVAEAEEATQEVFIRAASALDRFEGRARHSTWLYRITTNYCLNKLRDRERRRELWEAHGEQTTPATLARDPAKMMIMRHLLSEADPRCAEAAVAVYIDGMSHEEAAEQLGVSRRTVGNLCDRFVGWARKRLQD